MIRSLRFDYERNPKEFIQETKEAEALFLHTKEKEEEALPGAPQGPPPPPRGRGSLPPSEMYAIDDFSLSATDSKYKQLLDMQIQKNEMYRWFYPLSVKSLKPQSQKEYDLLLQNLKSSVRPEQLDRSIKAIDADITELHEHERMGTEPPRPL